MRRALLGWAGLPLALMGACSAIPTYTLQGQEAGSADAASDAQTCVTKPKAEHFRFFMTKSTVNGDLHGAGAPGRPDAICDQIGGLHWPGTHWVAYYWNTRTEHPSLRLKEPCDGWWVSESAKPDARAFKDRSALRGMPTTPVNVSEEGLVISGGAAQVWTGGTEADPGSRCGPDWNDKNTVGMTGWSGVDVSRWMNDNPSRGCEAEAHLYCIEQP